MTSRALGRARRSATALTVALAIGVAAGVVVALGTAGAATAQASPPVTARLVLARSQVKTGQTVRGNLVLTNRTKQSVDLNEGCTPRWDVVLGRGRKAPGVAFSLVCGTSSFPVPPGSHRRPFTVSTKGLRPGKYHAFLVASDPKFPTARPVPLTIVAS